MLPSLSFSPSLPLLSCSWLLPFRCRRLASQRRQAPKPGSAAAEGLSSPAWRRRLPRSWSWRCRRARKATGLRSRAGAEALAARFTSGGFDRSRGAQQARAAQPRPKRQWEKRPSRSSLSFRCDPTACPSLYKPWARLESQMQCVLQQRSAKLRAQDWAVSSSREELLAGCAWNEFLKDRGM